MVSVRHERLLPRLVPRGVLRQRASVAPMSSFSVTAGQRRRLLEGDYT
jgi:hypothetical protein